MLAIPRGPGTKRQIQWFLVAIAVKDFLSWRDFFLAFVVSSPHSCQLTNGSTYVNVWLMDGGAEHVVRRWHEPRQVSVTGSCLCPRPIWQGRGAQLEEVSEKAVFFSFVSFFLYDFLPFLSAVELDSTGGQRSMCPGKWKKFISM